MAAPLVLLVAAVSPPCALSCSVSRRPCRHANTCTTSTTTSSSTPAAAAAAAAIGDGRSSCGRCRPGRVARPAIRSRRTRLTNGRCRSSSDGSSESSSSSSSSSDVDSERKEAASGAVVAKDAKPAERSDPSPSSLPAWVESTVWLETAGHAAMAGLALVLLKVSAVEAAQRPGWLAPDVPNGVLWTLPLVASMFVLRAEPLRQWRALSEYEDFLREFVVPFVRKKSSFDMLLLAAGAGVSEELLFRGFGLNVLAERLPPLPGGVQADVAAVAVSGLVFGLLHAVTPVYALFATWAGLLLSTEYVVTGHLGAPMVTHALYDYVALLYLRTLPPLQRDAR